MLARLVATSPLRIPAPQARAALAPDKGAATNEHEQETHEREREHGTERKPDGNPDHRVTRRLFRGR
jgi:hypothetical protein